MHVVTKLEEWAVKYGGEQGLFRITLAGVEYVVLCREEETLEIERQRPFKVIRDSMMTSAVKSVGGYGLFATEGDEWRQDKRLTSPALNHASVQKYFETIQTMSKRLVEKWNQELDSKSSNSMTKVINRDCHHVLVDLSAKLFLGVDFDTLHEEGCKDAKDLRTLDLAIGDRALAPFAYWNIPIVGRYLDGYEWAIVRLKAKAIKVINEHQERCAAGDSPDEKTFCSKAVALNHSGKGTKLTHERLVGNILTMFVGAQDTQSSSFITALWLLASDKTDDKLQDELYQEALQINFETDSPRDLLDSAPRMRSFLDEAQRMFSAVPIEMFETLDESVKLQGEVLEPGTPLIRMTRFTGINPNNPCSHVKPGPNGEDATVFLPRRWLNFDPKDGKTIIGVDSPSNKNSGFLAFGSGLNMRDCPGRYYADVALVYMAGILVKEFKMELAPDHEPVGRVMGLTESVDRDLNFVLTKR